MKRVLTFAFSMLIILLVIIGILNLDVKTNKNVSEIPQEEKIDFHYSGDRPMQRYSIGEPDDPNARLNFEINKLKDPKTGRIPDNAKLMEFEFAKKVPQSSGLKVRSSNGRLQNLNLDFTSAGPNNVGGRTRALAIDVTDENVIFAGGVSGGLWRSTNMGSTWNRVSSRTDLPNIRSIVQDTRPGRENTWYYGTGEIFPGGSAGAPGAPYRGNGIYKSTNGGITWSVLPATFVDDIGTDGASSVFNYTHNLAIDPSNLVQDEVYAAVLGGIVRSTDGFNTFELVLGHDDVNNNSDGIWTEVAVTSNGVVYATISNDLGDRTADVGYFRSETGLPGSWEEITPPGVNDRFRRTVMAIDPSNENIVYFLSTEIASGGGFDFGLYRYDASAPEESRWQDRSSSIPPQEEPIGGYDPQQSYNMVVAVHPGDPNTVFIGGTNIFRSSNAFEDDTQVDWVGGYDRSNRVRLYFNHHPDQHALVFFPSDPDRMLSGHDGGVSLTNNNRETRETEVTDQDGEVDQTIIIQWEDLNTGYFTSQFYALAVEQENLGDFTVMGGMQDNSTFLTFDSDRSAGWQDIGAGDGSFCYYDNGALTLSAQRSSLFRFVAINGQFEFFNISPPGSGSVEGNSPYLFINPFTVDPTNPNKIFVASEGQIYYTLDVRRNPSNNDWISFGRGTLPAEVQVSALGASLQPQNVLYIGTENGRLFRTPNSTSLNELIELNTADFPSNGYINCIAVDPRDADNLFVVFTNYNVDNLWHSTDGGNTWTLVSGNLQTIADDLGGGPSARWLSILPNGQENVYLLGTSVGLFSTQNINGANTVWEQEGANTIGNTPVEMIKVRPIDGYIAVGTHGNGVYEATLDVPLFANLETLEVRCNPGTVTLRANLMFQGTPSDFDLNYEWFIDGVSQGNSLTSATITTTSEASFQVRVTNSVNGETALSNVINIDFSEANSVWCGSIVTSIDDEFLAEELAIFPNPSPGLFTIKTNTTNIKELKVYDINGGELNTYKFNDNTNTLDLRNVADGHYILEVFDGEQRITRRLVKEN